jgi:succinate-acetate transporter protein
MHDNVATNSNVGDSNGARTRQRSRYDYGGNPLARVNTGDSARFPAFGGEAQPGLYKPTTDRKFGNAAPLGLSAFALTTFVLSLINVRARGVTTPNIVIASAYAYGGLVQLLAGMWYVVTIVNPATSRPLTLIPREMAVGNTFGATALSSYGGFWISFAIVLTPGGFQIAEAYATAGDSFEYAFGFYIFGWFIFTFLLLICTLRSTVAFFSIFSLILLTSVWVLDT